MFALVRFKPQVELTQESQEILEFLNFEQQQHLLQTEGSYETLTEEVVVSTFSIWELALKALIGHQGEAIKNTITGEYFGAEVLGK